MRFQRTDLRVRSDVAGQKCLATPGFTMESHRRADAKVLEATAGAADVKVEQTTGLPMLTIHIDREKPRE